MLGETAGDHRCCLSHLAVVVVGRNGWMVDVPVVQYFGLTGCVSIGLMC